MYSMLILSTYMFLKIKYFPYKYHFIGYQIWWKSPKSKSNYWIVCVKPLRSMALMTKRPSFRVNNVRVQPRSFEKLKRQIIENYPKDYTIHLRKATELSPKVNLSILRALLRRHQKHLHSERSYQWDKQLKKPMAIYRYRIL